MRIKLDLLILFAAAAAVSGCSIASPEIRLTNEKTLIENQIIGEYREIEPDAWAVSSAKTAVARSKGDSARSADMQIFRAMKIREFNEESLRRYKDDGAVGEGRNGFVEYRPSSKYESDRDFKKILLSVVEDENKARQIIFERSVVLSGKTKPADSDIESVAKKFSDDERSRARKNDWIQGNDGLWQRKK